MSNSLNVVPRPRIGLGTVLASIPSLGALYSWFHTALLHGVSSGGSIKWGAVAAAAGSGVLAFRSWQATAKQKNLPLYSRIHELQNLVNQYAPVAAKVVDEAVPYVEQLDPAIAPEAQAVQSVVDQLSTAQADATPIVDAPSPANPITQAPPPPAA